MRSRSKAQLRYSTSHAHLAKKQVLDVHSQVLRVHRIHCVFNINKCRGACACSRQISKHFEVQGSICAILYSPPWRCISATACNASVVFPLDSGPYISITRPRGYPPPMAISRVTDPEENVSTFTVDVSPNF